MDQLLDTVICPITLDIIKDPVQLPCCGKSVSRAPLIAAYRYRQSCPMCRANLTDFDPVTAPTNRTLASLIESMNKAPEPQVVLKEHQWSGNIEWIDPKKPSIGRLSLNIARSHFTTKKSIFIAIVDNSGSMSGSPWRQVQTALVHILGLTAVKTATVETRIITYNSYATLLQPMQDPSQLETAKSQILGISAGGGTNFLSAYQELSNLLETYQDKSASISSISVAFLTDGQAQNDKSTLTEALTHIFDPFKEKFNIIVHAIGFSRDCDKSLLEQMRTAGTSEGTFRYAEPSDDSDTLCGKLTDLFTLSEKAATAKILVNLPDGFEFVSKKNECFIHVEPLTRKGSLVEWIHTTLDDPPACFTALVNSLEDQDVEVNVHIKETSRDILQLWLRKALDGMAAELMQLNTSRNNVAPNLLKLHYALFLSRLKSIKGKVEDTRIDQLKSQIVELMRGGSINEGRLADMRFSSMFTAEVAKKQKTRDPEREQPQERRLFYHEKSIKYSHKHDYTNRNDLQMEIMDAYPKRICQQALDMVANASYDDLVYTDANGNTSLHLAAYCGSDSLLSAIINKLGSNSSAFLNLENNDGETPVTLAIKRRGFYDSLTLMTGHGGYIASHRIEPLKQFCINNGYVRTASVISNLNTSDEAPVLNTSMNEAYLRFQWDSAVQSGKERLAKDWFEPTLSKCMVDIVEELLKPDSLQDFVIPWKWFVDFCFPPKPDHPEVDKYVKLLTMVLDVQPTLLNERDPETGDTVLITAVSKGNLPLVQLVLDRGVDIDDVSELGNTALWIACAKRYPCIVSELISLGADVNRPNKKGNRPLSAVCQMGPAKVAQLLIAAGAEVTFFNQNGDTPLLLSCRNGQTEVAQLLLSYCDMEFVLFRAAIDGFDALFASVEADRPECVRLLFDYGVSLEEKTAPDNEIIQEATPLHLAAHYGRLESASLLLELGADPNSRDINGMTPLHTAVLRKHLQIVELLLSSNADPSLTDKMGNTPSAFSRDPEVLALLVNPVSEPLHLICSTRITSKCGYTSKDVEDILANKSAVLGMNEPKDVIMNAKNNNGMNALITSVVHSNLELADILIKLGLDPSATDTRGISAHVWAQWAKNPRMLKLLNTPTHELPEVSRMRAATKLSPESMAILFLSDPCPYVPSKSSFSYRMEGVTLLTTTLDSAVDSRKQLIYDTKSNDPTKVFEKPKSKTEQNVIDLPRESLWKAKVEAVSSIAAACNEGLSAAQLVALFLYTNDRMISEVITRYLCGLLQTNESSILPNIKCLWTAIDQLPPFKAEVYTASRNIDRRLFQVGNTVASPAFISATSLWPVALESINFEKEGTVFIIKSFSKGKLISSHSNFPFESEVLFTPGTRFTVAKWYRGDVIALGQPNIRDHTFGLNEEQINVIMNNSKPLIIELHEEL